MDNEQEYLSIINQQVGVINRLSKLLEGEDISNFGRNIQMFDIDKLNNYKRREFILYMRDSGLSYNTIDTYSRQCGIFFKEFKKIDHTTLRAFEDSLRHCNPRTYNAKITAISKYCKFANFKYDFKHIKVQTRNFCDNAINEEQYQRFIEYAERYNINAWKIAKIIANTGVRVSELVNLRVEDLKHGYVDIISKANKSRRIYFPTSLVQELQIYCNDGTYLIENYKGNKMTTRGIHNILKKVGEKAELPLNVVYPHSFRHFFAKMFLKSNNDIALLGDLLGHSDLKTTSIYTRMTTEEQKTKINKVVNW